MLILNLTGSAHGLMVLAVVSPQYPAQPYGERARPAERRAGGGETGQHPAGQGAQPCEAGLRGAEEAAWRWPERGGRHEDAAPAGTCGTGDLIYIHAYIATYRCTLSLYTRVRVQSCGSWHKSISFSLGDHYVLDISQRNGVRRACRHLSKQAFKLNKWLEHGSFSASLSNKQSEGQIMKCLQ